MIFAEGQPGLVGLFDFLGTCSMTIDVARACGTGFGVRKNGIRLPLVVTRDRDGQHLVLCEVIFDGGGFQQAVQRVGIIQKAYVERFCQCVAVLADALNRDRLVEAVDRQLDRRVDINADRAGGEKYAQ